MQDEEKTIREHLNELKGKFLFIGIIFFFLFFVIFLFSNKLILIILNFYNLNAVTLSPVEYITTQMSLSLILSLIILIPLLFYQVFLYIRPLLGVDINKSIWKYTTASFFLAMCGATFGAIIFAKFSLSFLSYTTDRITNMWSLSSILNYLFFCILAFALTFQETILIPLLVKTGIINLKSIEKKRKVIVISIMIIAGIITPSTDLLNMFIVAIPMYLFFEVGIIISKITGGNKHGVGTSGNRNSGVDYSAAIRCT